MKTKLFFAIASIVLFSGAFTACSEEEIAPNTHLQGDIDPSDGGTSGEDDPDQWD